MKAKTKTIMFVVLLLAFGQLLQAQVLDTCEQWGNYFDGTYCVYNNLWGEEAGPQCITAQSTTRWTVTSTQSGSGVKTYPNSSREPLGVTIGSLISLTSSMNTSSPHTGAYCTAWDIWAPEEVMIWINKYGDVAPWGSFVETASIGGATWDVYKNGYPGFVLNQNVDSYTVDVKAILDYCVSKGWLHNDGILQNVQGGFEITSTDGVARDFTMNSYSVSIQSTEPLEEPPAPAPASETPQIGSWYSIHAGHSNKCLSTENAGTAAGTNVVQWSYTDGQHQEWRIEEAEEAPGYFRLINRAGGMCLQVQDWNTADGGNVQIGQPAAYQNNQQWTFEQEGIYYTIVNRNSDKLADVASTATNNGANIHQWSYYGDDADSQRWSFQTVGSTGQTPTPTPTSTPTPTPTDPGGPGDVNTDGAITIIDALMIAQYYVGLNPGGFTAANADVNCDGSITIVDALIVAQYYVGLVGSFC